MNNNKTTGRHRMKCEGKSSTLIVKLTRAIKDIGSTKEKESRQSFSFFFLKKKWFGILLFLKTLRTSVTQFQNCKGQFIHHLHIYVKFHFPTSGKHTVLH